MEKPFVASWDLDPVIVFLQAAHKALVALSELAIMVAVEFLLGRGLGGSQLVGTWMVLKLCVHSRHCFYLDCRFIFGWLKDNGGCLALDTATKASAA